MADTPPLPAWDEVIPPPAGTAQLTCPQCGGTAECYRTGTDDQFGHCGCGWARFRRLTSV